MTLAMKTPMTAVASSGAELPAAMNVAPATSSCSFITATTFTFTSVNIETQGTFNKAFLSDFRVTIIHQSDSQHKWINGRALNKQDEARRLIRITALL